MPSMLSDELLYSLLGRLVAYNALGDPRGYLALLFGTRDVIPGIDLPTRLESLHHRLGKFLPCDSADELINVGTIYPYHRPFLTTERHEAVRKILLFGGGKGLKTLLGRVANRFGASPPLCYCTACIEEDISWHGAPYWHRSHQLPGVTYCATHHIELIVHVLPSTLGDKQRLILPPGKPNRSTHRVSANAEQIRFSVLSRDLLAANLPALPPLQLRAVYEDAISARGFRFRKNWIDHEALANALRSYYQDFKSFTHQDRLLSTPIHPLGWLRSLFDRPSRSSHPMCHLLLIGFLFKTIDEFRQATRQADQQIRDSEPPPQKEIHATHDPLLDDASLSCRFVAQALNLSVTTVVSHRRALGVPIAERRKHLDSNRLKSITTDLAEGLSPSFIAQRQHVSVGTVYRLRAESRTLFQTHTKRRHDREQQERRRRWQEAVRKHRHTGLRAARSAEAATYAWLYRHDNAWLQRICKTLRAPRTRMPRVDWAARDLELCQRLQEHVDLLMSKLDRPRISKTLILRKLGDAMVRANLVRLPGVQASLEKIVESSQSFQFFRIDRAIKQLADQGLSMPLWRIQRLAGIRKFTEALRAYANGKATQAI